MIVSGVLQRYEAITHAFTDRSGGISTAPYDTFNLAYHVGDVPADVDRNHALLAERMGYDDSRLVHMRQIHSDKIVICTLEMDFKSRPECDALITDIPGQPLMVMSADCTPVLLFDPMRRAIAAIHAGRAGALKNIVGKSIAVMQERFGCKPADILAVLGPSIHACCYEVGVEVAQEVEGAGFAKALHIQNERHYLDVNAILQIQLHAAGILPTHTEVIALCTACHSDKLFSHRAHQGQTGRQAAVIMLK